MSGISPEELGQWLNDTDVDGGNDENQNSKETHQSQFDGKGESNTTDIEPIQTSRNSNTMQRPKFCPPIEPSYEPYENKEHTNPNNHHSHDHFSSAASSASSADSHIITPRNSMSHGRNNSLSLGSVGGHFDANNFASSCFSPDFYRTNSMNPPMNDFDRQHSENASFASPGSSRRVSQVSCQQHPQQMNSIHPLDRSDRSADADCGGNALDQSERSERSTRSYDDAFLSNSGTINATSAAYTSNKRQRYHSTHTSQENRDLFRAQSEPYPEQYSMEHRSSMKDSTLRHRSASDGQGNMREAQSVSSCDPVRAEYQRMMKSMEGSMQSSDPDNSTGSLSSSIIAKIPQMPDLGRRTTQQRSSSLPMWNNDGVVSSASRDNRGSTHSALSPSGRNSWMCSPAGASSNFRKDAGIMQDLYGSNSSQQDSLSSGEAHIQEARRSLSLSAPRKDVLFTPQCAVSDATVAKEYNNSYTDADISTKNAHHVDRTDQENLKRPQLSNSMLQSQHSQMRIHEWDKSMGLKRSHSKTMYKSRLSREALMGVQREYECGVRMMEMMEQMEKMRQDSMRGSMGFGGMNNASVISDGMMDNRSSMGYGGQQYQNFPNSGQNNIRDQVGYGFQRDSRHGESNILASPNTSMPMGDIMRQQ